jgi:hypothetical protein
VIPLVTSTYSVVGTDLNGCTASASVTVTLNLLGGLLSAKASPGAKVASDNSSEPNATSEAEPVALYPNPTTGTLYLQNAPVNSTVEVYSMTGVRLYVGQVESEEVQRLDLNGMPAGMYVVRVYNQGQVIRLEKIVRQ